MKKYQHFTILALLAALLVGLAAVPATTTAIARPQATATAFHFVMAADSRDDYSVLPALSRKMVTLAPAFGFFAGDLCGSFDITCINNIWKPALDGNSNNGMLAKTFVSRGNHDSGTLSTWQGLWDFQTMAAHVGASHFSALTSDATYSFDYGNSHFAVIDGPSGGSNSWTASQIAWLDADLTAAEGRGVVHEFLISHGPMYTVTSSHSSEAPSSALKAVLNGHPISAGFHGHEHITAYTHVTDGVVSGINDYEQFTIGRAGAPVYSITKPVGWSANQNAFADIAVNGSDFTVTVYSQGGSALWSRTFSDAAPTPPTAPPPPSGSNVNVMIAGASQGSYALSSGSSTRQSYSVNNGPVKVYSADGATKIIASERVAYSPDGGSTWTSFAEMLGLPSPQLTSSYVMPWYNNVEWNTQLRFGNVGNASTTVTVRIGGAVVGTYALGPSQSTRVSYAGVNNGPVVITSSGSVPIIASERVAYTPDGGSTWSSFSELMGLPANRLANSYVMPWYNNLEMNTQVRFGNVGTANTTITVKIGGAIMGTYNLAPSQSARVSYPGVNNGPVVISSSGSVKIVASERVAYYDGSNWTSFSEMMGLPRGSLSSRYWLPIYDNIHHNDQLRFGNVGASNTTVSVKVGGVLRGSYALAPNQSTRVSYSGLNAGPVQVCSSEGVPIVASHRVIYLEGLTPTSFGETMGLPASQLAASYMMPWYNNIELNTQLRFAVP